MRILCANDDGFDAPGLVALAAGLRADGHEVAVVAPEKEQSAKSHSLTLHKPLRIKPRGEGWWSVSGTPADSIYVALHGELGLAPDLVISGVNRGSNLAQDIHYSGTVAAAREAALADLPAIAVSLHVAAWRPTLGGTEAAAQTLHFDTAVAVVRRLLAVGAHAALPPRALLNVNVPNVPGSELAGVVAARVGRRVYDDGVDVRHDPFGRPYAWIGGPHRHFDDLPRSDGPLIEQGFATVSPLTVDPTLETSLHDLHELLR